ncbi:hypothetical protein BDV96DRAFT_3290 [Lophiotrema nucula]|uniref:Uncharacterized protein n=1 Tax=Lophiotrema nucula TaxID=690887 RepID=A0A6A5ZUG5_9PLEO|nr:hypothetical protein BDV96DRAFT_3290 [Lophiotrema nucula]
MRESIRQSLRGEISTREDANSSRRGKGYSDTSAGESGCSAYRRNLEKARGPLAEQLLASVVRQESGSVRAGKANVCPCWRRGCGYSGELLRRAGRVEQHELFLLLRRRLSPAALLLGVGEFARASAGSRQARIGGRHSVGESNWQALTSRGGDWPTRNPRGLQLEGQKLGKRRRALTSDLRDASPPASKKSVNEGREDARNVTQVARALTMMAEQRAAPRA